jgi:hypothetical protein
VKDEAEKEQALYAEVMRNVRDAASARAFLRERAVDEPDMLALLRLPVPVALLEAVAVSDPWPERPRVLGGVCLNARTPRSLAQRLLPGLFWRDLADVAAATRLDGGVRVRAEALLKERLPDLRLGERISLGRLATPVVLRQLAMDPDSRVLDACLQNPRLSERDLALLLQAPDAPRTLLEAVAATPRWQKSYAVRLALVLQPRCPPAIALAQLTSLAAHDLRVWRPIPAGARILLLN